MSVSGDIYIFIGPPGAGKGSLSHLCVKSFGWHQLSTGNLCRKHIVQNTPIGQKIDFAIKSGNLIDDVLVTDMVNDWLSEHFTAEQSLILDGFPRTVEQARALAELLNKKNVGVQAKLSVIKLSASRDTVTKRLMARTICPNESCQAVYSQLSETRSSCEDCGANLITRCDDTLVAIRERLDIFDTYEKDLIAFYKQAGNFIGEINVEQSLENVFRDFMVIFNATKAQKALL